MWNFEIQTTIFYSNLKELPKETKKEEILNGFRKLDLTFNKKNIDFFEILELRLKLNHKI